jgi:lysozyme family protein
MDSLSQALSRHGVKMVPMSKWDGEPGSLKNMETDSVLMIEIKNFWTESKAAAFRTNAKTSIHFAIHLGVKKEGKVFTRKVEVEKEITVGRMTPERMEEMVNQILTDIFDSFFSNPYEFNQCKGGKTNAVLLLVGSFSCHWYRHLCSSEFDCTCCGDEVSPMEI